MASLTTVGRKRMKHTQFALPGKRYPINDAAHARVALSRISAHGTPAEQATVKRKVASRFPSIKVSGIRRKKA